MRQKCYFYLPSKRRHFTIIHFEMWTNKRRFVYITYEFNDVIIKIVQVNSKLFHKSSLSMCNAYFQTSSIDDIYICIWPFVCTPRMSLPLLDIRTLDWLYNIHFMISSRYSITILFLKAMTIRIITYAGNGITISWPSTLVEIIDEFASLKARKENILSFKIYTEIIITNKYQTSMNVF